MTEAIDDTSGPSTRPVIGISTYEETATWRGWQRRASLVSADYVAGIAEVGAIPVLLPSYGGSAAAGQLVTRFDGLLLVGGGDIDPVLYGEPAGPHLARVQPERDRWESALARAALAADLPILGVCRGAQVLNVVRGGTLIQHLPQATGADRHRCSTNEFASSRIRLRPDVLPGTVLGAEHTASCFHHQAVATLGAGLTATGWAADGVIEAVADLTRPFVLGVQWHPELEPDRRLFRAFVAAAARRAAVSTAVSTSTAVAAATATATTAAAAAAAGSNA